MAGFKKDFDSQRDFLTHLIEIREQKKDDNGKKLSRKKLCDRISEALGEEISENSLEKIANGRMALTPDIMLMLSNVYNMPELCNEYCNGICPIGQIYTPKVVIKTLPHVVLEMISSLNSIQKNKDELIEIAADGEITEDEYEKFNQIMEDLDKMSITVKSLQLWAEKMKANGIINEKKIIK